MQRIFFFLAAIVLGLAVGSCGGGSGGEDEPLELIAEGLAGFDGTIRLDSATGQCEIDPVFNLVTVGESGNASKFRTHWGFITFDLSALPAGATIVSATANIRLVVDFGGDSVFAPNFFGNVVMEHIDIGTALDPTDMDSPSLSGELVGGDASPTFLATNNTEEVKTADITAEVQRDLTDGRTRSSLRLSLQVTRATDDDNQFDVAEFVAFEDQSGVVQPQRPTLQIRYREP